MSDWINPTHVAALLAVSRLFARRKRLVERRGVTNSSGPEAAAKMGRNRVLRRKAPSNYRYIRSGGRDIC